MKPVKSFNKENAYPFVLSLLTKLFFDKIYYLYHRILWYYNINTSGKSKDIF